MNEHTSLQSALEEIYGPGTMVASRRPVAGGDINRAFALSLSNGEMLFMKANSIGNIGFFRAEAEGLQAIRSALQSCGGSNVLSVPEVLAIGSEENASFLLMEYIEEGRKSRTSSEELGRGLAMMHLADTGSFVPHNKYGFLHDNYIGAGEQINTPADSWIGFFVNCRLIPQFQKASSYFSQAERNRFEAFCGKAERYLTEPNQPSLLHGDLWAGNYMIDHKGHPWLIDPAAYVGHAEADLAMTELFGGFDAAFYDAYKETAGIDPGYKNRRDLYNLYHLLNHLNLFGGGYLGSARAILRRYM